jgi:hypothetical protein
MFTLGKKVYNILNVARIYSMEDSKREFVDELENWTATGWWKKITYWEA